MNELTIQNADEPLARVLGNPDAAIEQIAGYLQADATAKFGGQLAILQLAADSIKVTGPVEYSRAAEIMKDSKRIEKGAESAIRPFVAAADRLHDRLLQVLKGVTAATATISKKCQVGMETWDREQAVFRRKAELELERTARDAREKAERDAQALLDRGYVAEAQVAKQTAAAIIPDAISLPSTVPEVAGVSKRGTWVAEVADMGALLKAVAEGKIPLYHEISVRGVMQRVCVFEASSVLLRHYATRLEADFKWPGVKVECRTGYTTRV